MIAVTPLVIYYFGLFVEHMEALMMVRVRIEYCAI